MDQRYYSNHHSFGNVNVSRGQKDDEFILVPSPTDQPVKDVQDPPTEDCNQGNNTLKGFWDLLTFRKLPTTPDELHVSIQVEMMKHYTRAPICKIDKKHVDKYLTRLFVKEKEYYCGKSRLLITSPEIRCIIDMLLNDGLNWHIETNLEGNSYLFATWQHWNVLMP
jgi:hypothetical protein